MWPHNTDMTSPEVQLENLRDRIEEADISEDDRDGLRAFDDALDDLLEDPEIQSALLEKMRET